MIEEIEKIVGKGLLEGRYYFNENYEIVDKKGEIPPIKIDCATEDGSESCWCDASTLLKHLNKKEILINHKARHVDALIKVFNDEKEKADGELKEELTRIGNIELKI